MKKYISLLIKIGITISIFYWILKGKDHSQLLNKLSDANILFLIIASVVVLLNILAMSYRWHLINYIFKFDVPILRLYKHYLIAFGFNVFLPGGIGGDIWRIRFLNKTFNKKLEAVLAPSLERITGLIAILLALPLAYIGFESFFIEYNLDAVIYLFILAIIGIILFLFTPIGAKVIHSISVDILY